MNAVRYCDDPLVLAGIITCQQCGRVAYPTDAAWIDSRRVLASFPPVCAHTAGGMWLGDPAELASSREWWCHARTRTTGDPCRNRARPGGLPCHAHGGR